MDRPNCKDKEYLEERVEMQLCTRRGSKIHFLSLKLESKLSNRWNEQ